MKILHHLEELASLGTPLHLALGVFDGVHLGHQAVIARAVEAAGTSGGLAGLVTFDPHPIRIIAPSKAPTSLLATLDHKARIVSGLGIGLFVPLRFDASLAEMEADTFLGRLLSADVRTIAVGEDWRFGKGRHGDVELLQQRARTAGFRLEAVPPVMHDGERISSTRIRQAIRDGNLAAAAELLGRPYSVSGEVIHGRQLGRTIGFPTANLFTGDSQLPPDGVWTITAMLADRTEVRGVANLGHRPTIDGTSRNLEAHLLDFSQDIYGQELEIRFESYLRPEKKFETLDALTSQIRQDVTRAREIRKEDT